MIGAYRMDEGVCVRELSMRLCLVLRSYGGENDKERPSYFGKDVVVASFVRAASFARDAGVDVEVVFANDGPIPQPRLAVMERHGRVMFTDGGPVGLLGSYRFALDLPDRLALSDGDVIAFIEDDYLLTQDAFVVLARAAEELPKVSSFALTGKRPPVVTDAAARARYAMPRAWKAQPDEQVGEDLWVNVMSTTSTFAARVGVLRADRDIHELAMRPFRNRFLDHELCLISQGVVPYHGREFVFGLGKDFVPGIRGVLRAAVLLPFRFLMNARARKQQTPHYLFAVVPDRAAHLEVGEVPGCRDWAAEAQAVKEWGVAHEALPVSR